MVRQAQLQPRTPITIISGFLGAGKTTLLRHILNNETGLRVGVVVNDLAAVNIDAALVRAAATGARGQPAAAGGGGEVAPAVRSGARALGPPREGPPGGAEPLGEPAGASVEAVQLVELTNGCVCCSAADDLLLGLAELIRVAVAAREAEAAEAEAVVEAAAAAGSAAQGARSAGGGLRPLYDHVVVESTGVAEPAELRARLLAARDSGHGTFQWLRFSTMVTVIDSSDFAQLLADRAPLSSRPRLFDSSGGGGGEGEGGGEGGGAVGGAGSGGGYGGDAVHEAVCRLLLRQAECADVLVLNKLDLLLPGPGPSQCAGESADAARAPEGGVAAEGDSAAATAAAAAAEASVAQTAALLRALNPTAAILKTTHGRVRPEDVLAAAASGGQAGGAPLGLAAAEGGAEGAACAEAAEGGAEGEVDEWCVETCESVDEWTRAPARCAGGDAARGRAGGAPAVKRREALAHSLAYRRSRPFSPARLRVRVLRHMAGAYALGPRAEGEPPAAAGGAARAEARAPDPSGAEPPPAAECLRGLLRAKGFAWLAPNPLQAYELQYAAGRLSMGAGGLWDGAGPRARGAANGLGPARQELVFIGTRELRPAALTALLDSCLCDAGDGAPGGEAAAG